VSPSTISPSAVSLSRVAVHQIIPFLHAADASGAHTLAARDALRAGGFDAEVFAGDMDEELREEAHPFAALDGLAPAGRTVLLYQLAVGSDLVGALLRRPEPLLVNYHNLTPASFFWRWAPDWLAAVDSGRRDLYRLAGVARHAIAVSRFNQLDLVSAGYRSTSVVPPFVPMAGTGAPTGSDGLLAAGASTPSAAAPGAADGHSADGHSADGAARSCGGEVGVGAGGPSGRGAGASELSGRDAGAGGPSGRGAGAAWLFVGKLLPHKAAHDLLQSLAVYRRIFDASATLTLVGGEPVPSYSAALREMADALGLAGAVHFLGRVDDRTLESAYRSADVLVCLSDHEGFCFPLLEAMRHRVPVVAFGTAAIPETVGDAGLVLRRKDPLTVAAAVDRVTGDRSLRDRLDVAAQRRLDTFAPTAVATQFVAEVRRIIERQELVPRSALRSASPSGALASPAGAGAGTAAGAGTGTGAGAGGR
jgi:hypothetical protein